MIKTKPFALTQKKIFVVIIFSIIAAVAVISYFAFFNGRGNPSTSKPAVDKVLQGQLKTGTSATRQQLEQSLATAQGSQRYQTYLLLGNEYLAAKDYTKAAEALQQAEKLGGANPDLLYTIADAYEQAGDSTKALDYYRRTQSALTAKGALNPYPKSFLEKVNAKISQLESQSR